MEGRSEYGFCSGNGLGYQTNGEQNRVLTFTAFVALFAALSTAGMEGSFEGDTEGRPRWSGLRVNRMLRRVEPGVAGGVYNRGLMGANEPQQCL